MSNFQLYKKAISATGTTTENEPIIKSDGASSDVMQWLSNDESSNVTISEDGSNNLDLVVSAGNVGVGVSPDGTDWNANAKVVHAYQNDSDGAMFKAESSSASLIVSAGNTQAQIGTVEAVPLRFYTSNAERLSIDSAGMLVTQAAGIIGTASSSGSLTMYGGSSWPGGKIVLSGGNSPSTGDIKFYTGVSTETPTERLSISATGLTTVTNPGWPLKNEISNSGFDCWSNSTLEDATGTELVDNGDFATTIALSDWTKYEGGGGGSVAVVSNELKFTQVTSATMTCQQGVTTVEGKLYRLTYDQKTQSSANYTKVTVGTGSGGASSYDIRNPSWSTSAEGATTYTFEAESATTYITIWDGQTNGETSTWDDFSLKEVVPGCIASNDYSCDGWAKDGATAHGKSYRQHKDATLTKEGSFYSQKFVSHASSDTCLYQVPFSNISSYAAGRQEEVLERVAGRTMTFGAWVYSDSGAADDVAIFISDYERGYLTSHHDVSAYHSDSTGWEWLEVTFTFGDSPAGVYVGFYFDAATTAYISQPILAYASAIGEGNYSRPSGEVIWCEKSIRSNTYNNTSVSNATVNLEADTDGKIPKGASAVYLSFGATASAYSASNSVYLYGETIDGGTVLQSGVAGSRVFTNGVVPCDEDGDINAYVNAGTWTGSYVNYTGVQLR